MVKQLGRYVVAAVGLVALIVVIAFSGSLVENLNAGDAMVLQALDGKLSVYSTPGWKPQMLGKITKYRKRFNFEFMSPQRGGKTDESIEVRFNDGGHGRVSGTMAVEIPTVPEQLLRIHQLYGSQQSLERDLIWPIVNKVIYMTGPTMSSKESYADRRNELLSMIDDQIKHGVYRTRSFQRKEQDPLSGQEKTVTAVEIVIDQQGNPVREDESALSEFGIKTFNLAINGLAYAAEVEAQIKQQQEMVMAVQTSMMEAKRAEQQRITTEQNGMAEAAKAKWAQEVEKATAVTSAEKNRAVAALDVQTAELQKRAQILRGEGEAEAKRLVMNADGALEKKLAAVVEINAAYAKAIQNYAGNWQPAVVMAGQGGQNSQAMVPGGGALPLIELLTAKTARDLSLDLSLTGVAKTKKGE